MSAYWKFEDQIVTFVEGYSPGISPHRELCWFNHINTTLYP